MKRRIITIDEAKCDGCGLCATACHEGAIAMVDGKARLLADDYCDGLGDCLPVCPTGAIRFEEREALPYDEAAVKARMQVQRGEVHGTRLGEGSPAGGCPGSRAHAIRRPAAPQAPQASAPGEPPQSELGQWPVQIRLAPVNAPYFEGAHLLIAADCAAYAYAQFHQRFMKDRITLIGCPKLDDTDYSEKLTEILRQNDIRSVTVARMEVPCCGGLSAAVIQALKDCGKMIRWSVVTLSTDGGIL